VYARHSDVFVRLLDSYCPHAQYASKILVGMNNKVCHSTFVSFGAEREATVGHMIGNKSFWARTQHTYAGFCVFLFSKIVAEVLRKREREESVGSLYRRY
jgi:hypothetical protein